MSVLTSSYAALQILELSARVLVDHRLGRFTRERGDRVAEQMARRVVRKTQMHVSVRGKAIPTGRAFVVMSNHQSHMDIPLLWYVMQGHTLRFCAKSEFRNVPIWGPALEKGECVMIDRKDRVRAIESLKRAERLVESGVNVWIAPEGTRSRDGRLAPFKKGGFHLAAGTGADILPIAINGTINVLPPDTLSIRKHIPIDVVVGSPIATANRDMGRVMEEVREFLEEHVDQDVYAG